MIRNRSRQEEADISPDRNRIRQSGNTARKIYEPVNVTEYNGGTLYEFETELNAVLEAEFKNGYQPVLICCGESREEAIDPVNCYYSWQPDKETGKCPCCAVHFAYIPDCKPGEIILKANHQYVDIPVKLHSTAERNA